jgi:hypothetical protein
MLNLERERIDLKRKMYEETISVRRAREALERARIEAGDLTLSERLVRAGRSLSGRARSTYNDLAKMIYGESSKTRRRTTSKITRRRVTKRKVVKRRG